MPSLHLRGLSHAHTSATWILRDVDLDLARAPGADAADWVGVVGPNGAGKTTLLRLFAGELEPATGRVDVLADVAPRLVAQQVDALTDDIRAFAWRWDGAALKLRSRLELDPDDLDSGVGRGWSGLSPGQRKRWQLAAALSEDPDVLLLDEPTNHLDAVARDLVLDVLAGFRGLGLIVSHDREVLERLTTRTLRVERSAVELHPGAYADASARWLAAEQSERATRDRVERDLQRERRLLADVRRERHSAEVAPRRERRLAGASQPDAREAGRKFAQRKAESAQARRVGRSNARVARAEQAVAEHEVARDHRGPVGFHHRSTGRRVLATVRGDVVHAGGAVWLRDVDVALHRGERVHLAGANGAGKTTLLRAVLTGLDDSPEAVATLPQEFADPTVEVGRIRELDPAVRGRVLGTAATLGIDAARVLVTDAPSPGEARKLALARMLAVDASVLVLDEPTNHLDLPSIERLQDALADWPGALLLVTHDRALAEGTTTTSWVVADGRVTVADRSAGSGPAVDAPAAR